MKTKPRNKDLTVFTVGLVAAGAVHISEREFLRLAMASPDGSGAAGYLPYFNTLAFCLNLGILVYLLFYWIGTLQTRLLLSRSKRYLIATALLMVFYLALRSAKYRLTEDTVILNHALWYLYYAPIIFIPTLFLMTCLSMRRAGGVGRYDERLWLIPASALTLCVLTNDLHGLVFRFFGKPQILNGVPGSYTRSAGYYALIVFLVIAFVYGMVILTKINRSTRSFKRVITPFLFLLLMLALLLGEKSLGRYNLPRPYNPPEIIIFCMLGALESCVRSRLIPYNENYVGFYAGMSIPAVITDRSFEPVYCTSVPVEADKAQMKSSLSSPVNVSRDTLLYGFPINAGYGFYTEDGSELRRLNEQLEEANELLASENELIRAENELKEKLARVGSRNRIYGRVSALMYGKHKQLDRLLDKAEPGDRGFRETIALASVMTAYIKRGTNLILAEPENGILPDGELAAAISESARYLSCCGISAGVNFTDGGLTRGKAFALYTAFEEICESLIGSASLMNISLMGEALRISADCRELPPLAVPGAEVDVVESDGVYYITAAVREEAEL